VGSLRVPALAGSKGNGVQSPDRTAAVRESDAQSAIDPAGREGARRDDPKSEDLPADQVSVSSASRMICPERLTRGMRVCRPVPGGNFVIDGIYGPLPICPRFLWTSTGTRCPPHGFPVRTSGVPSLAGRVDSPWRPLPHTGVIILPFTLRVNGKWRGNCFPRQVPRLESLIRAVAVCLRQTENPFRIFASYHPFDRFCLSFWPA